MLGNPVELFSNLGKGVTQFFYEPAQGIIKGPIGAAKGFVKGTTGLVSKTVQGTFGTVSSITGGLATVLTSIISDKDYAMERQRENTINKPKNVVEGVGKGFKGLFKNIGKGITGIVTEPIKGYKKNKWKGAMAGGARGISGIIVKPIAGVLDAASMTAEGIKNTVSGQTTNEKHRTRQPRAFYGPYGVLKSYNERDAEVLFFMGKLKKGMFLNEKFVGQGISNDLRGELLIVCVFMSKVVLVSATTRKVIWVVDTKSILKMETGGTGLLLYTTPSLYRKTKNITEFLVSFRDQEVIKEVNKKISYVMKRL